MERQEILRALQCGSRPKNICGGCGAHLNSAACHSDLCGIAADLIEQQDEQLRKLAALDKIQQEVIAAQSKRIAELEASALANRVMTVDLLNRMTKCKESMQLLVEQIKLKEAVK